MLIFLIKYSFYGKKSTHAISYTNRKDTAHRSLSSILNYMIEQKIIIFLFYQNTPSPLKLQIRHIV
jgi:hypothetical protein